MLARKISRALELSNWVIVSILLAVLIVVDIAIVPPSVWWEGIRGLLTPAAPPEGITATTLGGLAGFTALASGLNWYAMAHYRDKGYGMGYRVGFIAGLRGERRELLPVGVTFRDTPENAARWKRWIRLLHIDQWLVFFCGAMLGMLLPTILMAHIVATTGEEPTMENVPTFTAEKLGEQYGQGMFYLMLFAGVLILFSTQLGIFEALVRNFTDAAHATSPRLRRLLEGGSTKVLLPVHVAGARGDRRHDPPATPVRLVQISANMSNLGALMFPFMLIYLNSKLPKPARPRPWHYVILVLNFLFFGFFFLNFVYEFFSGARWSSSKTPTFVPVWHDSNGRTDDRRRWAMSGGPYFDDLVVGQVFDWAPSMTLTAGAAAVHRRSSVTGSGWHWTPISRWRSPGQRRRSRIRHWSATSPSGSPLWPPSG